MIRAILNWFLNRNRTIFRFYNGKKRVSIDPIHCAMKLANDPDYLPRHIDEALNGDDEALQICSAAADRAFGVVGVEQGGLTITEKLDLLNQFDLWVHALKKNTKRLPASPPSMGVMSQS